MTSSNQTLHAEPDGSAPPARKRRRVEEQFTQVPMRESRALRLGELTFSQHGVLTQLVQLINAERGEYIGGLAAIADATQWPWGMEKLRRDLLALRDLGWIDYETTPGQRAPYRIRAGAIACLAGDEAAAREAEPPPNLLPGAASPEEVTSDEWRSPAPVTPLPERDRAPSQPPPGGGPPDSDSRLRRIEDQTLSPSPHGGIAINGGWESDHHIRAKNISPNVRASIERLLGRLTDADEGTAGRLVGFAKRGASQADFEDARAALAETRPDSPSRYACHIIDERLRQRA